MRIPVGVLLVAVVVMSDALRLSDNATTFCPRDCECDKSLASCRLIDANVQRFSTRVETLLIKTINSDTLFLDNYIFKNAGLHFVKEIKIFNSTIEEIQLKAFASLPYLNSVVLRATGLKSLQPDVFMSNAMLKSVNLCDNPLEHAFANLLRAPSLEVILLRNGRITHLNETSLLGLPNAVYIDLRNNKISAIHVKAFLKLPNLEELNLAGNLISTIPPLMLISNVELSVLKLSGNPLTTAASVNSESLETLDLSNCKIETITEEMFDDVPNLIDLKLASNGLKQVHVRAFRNLMTLSDVDLSGNLLTEIQSELFYNNTELNSINLSSNPGLKRLPALWKAKNGAIPVTHFDASNCAIDELLDAVFVAMNRIEYLNLSGNRLRSIPGGIFEKMISLKDLDLSNNEIEALDNKTFSTTINLHNLNLSKNPLKKLPPTVFTALQNLMTLDLSNCALMEFHWVIPENVLHRLTSMKILNISGNNFKTIRADQLEMVPNLSELDLSENPLECNEEFASLIHWLIQHNVQIPHSVPPTDASKTLIAIDDDQQTRWNQLEKLVCKDKPIEQVTNTVEKVTSPTTSSTTTPTPEDDCYDEEDDDDYDYSQYDQSTIVTRVLDMEEDTQEVRATLLEYANYTNVIMFLFGALTSATCVFALAYLVKVYRRPTHVLVSTLARNTRTDSGLVYKPLSEETVTPRTSTTMLSRLYQPYLYGEGPVKPTYQEIKPEGA